jgi:mRNA-degrading endonuclease toxin of MazEF toxin-antitoxin module
MTSDPVVFDRWDIAVALFPFTSGEQQKPRPMLVLSDAAFNLGHGHIIAAMITTAVHTRWPSDQAIGDLLACGLHHPSVVRWKIFTLPLTLAPRRIGTLSGQDREMMKAGFANVFLDFE